MSQFDDESFFMQVMEQLPEVGLANALRFYSAGKFDDAEQCALLVEKESPSSFSAYLILGNICLARQRHQQAFEYFKRALAIHESVDAYLGMASACYGAGNSGLAEKCLRKLLTLDTQHAEAIFMLANLLHGVRGREAEAKPYLQQLISRQHRVAECHLLLGLIYQLCEMDHQAARLAYLAAIEADPGYILPRANLAALYTKNNLPEDAVRVLQGALNIAPQAVELYEELGVALLALGRHQESAAIFQRGLALAPEHASLRSIYLFSLNYSELLTEQQVFAEHREFGRLCADPLCPLALRHANLPDPDKKLRIAYISGDFKHHAVVYFIEPILQHHARQQHEVYCYYTGMKQDQKTAAIRALADHWREVCKLSDEELAQLIRRDGIDVLIDLSGHTIDHRLLALARKPAPVQITWLGYGLTTGMQAMDYVLLDRYYAPEHTAEKVYVEKPVYLPVYRTFRPESELPVNTLPALSNGYVTFGSFNNFIKLTEDVLDVWAQLLHRVSNSRLFIIVGSEELISNVTEFFGGRGISANRLIVRSRMNLQDYLQAHHLVDVALDPFPFNGATTSFHSLWMGVPVITLLGSRIASRTGLSLLGPLGLEAFVANNRQEYLACGEYWAGNLPQLDTIRQGLRQRLRVSPLMDEVGFTQAIEHAYRQCWREWCHTQAG